MTQGDATSPPLYSEKVGERGMPGDALLRHALGAELNLPFGLFSLRNRGHGRVMDVRGGNLTAGAEICLFEAKELFPGATGDFRDIRNNQLFYIDADGHLVSAAANLHVSVTNGEVRLASLRPILPSTDPEAARGFPVRFRYDPRTATLHVLPSASSPQAASAGAQATDVLLEAVPEKKRPDGEYSWTALTDLIASASPFGYAADRGKQAEVNAVGDGGDEDDDPALMRRLRTVALPPSWREKVPPAAFHRRRSTSAAITEEDGDVRRWRRRQWDILPIRIAPTPASSAYTSRGQVIFNMAEEDAQSLGDEAVRAL